MCWPVYYGIYAVQYIEYSLSLSLKKEPAVIMSFPPEVHRDLLIDFELQSICPQFQSQN